MRYGHKPVDIVSCPALRDGQLYHRICTSCLKSLNGCFQSDRQKGGTDQARVLRDMVKRHLLRHPLLPRVVWDKSSAPESLMYESYEEIHASSIKEMLEYCRSIDQPRLFRYFWSNWYRPSFGDVGSRWEIKEDYASHLIKPRLDVLRYIICTGLVRSRIHLYRQVETGRCEAKYV
ncbi:hypothetical protein LIPSTDRAFT_163579 [Lipomyces starkeyi NRRL Y-11557]|uniref:Uncharacterized protein n=1 Tax=Lipomyces starkeyi NRRL Y-11557 TaxID=675824 RepID=A0A1E3PZZ4_LIPST|nr:hypothetical protein LIPSTDRAFT_163579 [Lipomyces starkeyi NRRL Y-11557]